MSENTWEPLYSPQWHSGLVHCLAFSPDGKNLATGGEDAQVRIWDLSEGRTIIVLRGHTDWIYGVRYSHRGNIIASGSEDGRVILWDREGRIQREYRFEMPVYSVEFSKDDSKMLVASEDGCAYLIETISGKKIKVFEHGGWVNSAKFFANERQLITASDAGTIKIWSISGELLSVLRGHSGAIYTAQLSPGNSLLASGSWDTDILLWDLQEARIVARLEGHTAAVYSLDFSPDGSLLASGSEDGTVRIWSMRSMSLIQIIEKKGAPIMDVKFSPSGDVLAAAYGPAYLLWHRKGKIIA